MNCCFTLGLCILTGYSEPSEVRKNLGFVRADYGDRPARDIPYAGSVPAVIPVHRCSRQAAPLLTPYLLRKQGGLPCIVALAAFPVPNSCAYAESAHDTCAKTLCSALPQTHNPARGSTAAPPEWSKGALVVVDYQQQVLYVMSSSMLSSLYCVFHAILGCVGGSQYYGCNYEYGVDHTGFDGYLSQEYANSEEDCCRQCYYATDCRAPCPFAASPLTFQ